MKKVGIISIIVIAVCMVIITISVYNNNKTTNDLNKSKSKMLNDLDSLIIKTIKEENQRMKKDVESFKKNRVLLEESIFQSSNDIQKNIDNLNNLQDKDNSIREAIGLPLIPEDIKKMGIK